MSLVADQPAAPAAPAAPAPADVAQPQQQQPAASPVQERIAQARAELAAAAEKGEQPSWAVQPRAGDGTWTTEQQPAATEAPAEPPAAATEASTDTTTEAPAAESQDAPAAVTTDTEIPGTTVRIPGRRPEDGELEIAVEDPELAERIRQLTKGYMRGQEARSALQEVRAFERQLQTDPASIFLATDERGQPRIPTAVRQDIVLQMVLADKELYDAVVAELSTYDSDETARREKALEFREKRIEAAQRAPQLAAVDQEVETALERTVELIGGYTPAGVDPAAFEDQVLADLEFIATRDRLTPDQLTPELIRHVAALRAGPGHVPAPAPAAPRTPAPVAPAAPAAPATVPAATAAPAAEAGRRLVIAQARKAAAAATAPAGAGAAPAAAAMPANQTVKERIAWARQHLK